MRSVSVSKLPAGAIAFCFSSVCCTWSNETPSVASFAFDSSM
jgi:hypothetical protein